MADIEYDNEVKRYTKAPCVPKEQWIAKLSGAVGSYDFLTILAQPENIVAGRASISQIELSNGSPVYDGPLKHELSIFIGRSFWGRNLGTLVASELIRLGFDELRAEMICAIVHPDNQAALRLLDRFGFVHTGVNRIDGGDHWQDGHLCFDLRRA